MKMPLSQAAGNRDFAMVEGLSPSLTLKRTQPIIEGASDFRFARKDR
jgi:hypothetical protein